MPRKNIFDQISSSVSFKREITRIEDLIHSKNGVRVESMSSLEPDVNYYPFEAFIDDTIFKKWKNRGTCIHCKDMRECLDLPYIISKDDPTMDDVLTYLEYVSNLFYLFNKISLKLGFRYYDTNITAAARDNVRRVLDCLNYEAKEIPEEDLVFVVEKDAAVTAVAETVPPAIAYSIIQYNHYSLKGDLETKREILDTIGRELETKIIKLSDIDLMLTDAIFYLMNNIHVRRDNRTRKEPYYRDTVARMSLKKLEDWYDELYQMCLLAFLMLDQDERYRRYRELKAQIES